ncbi:MAG: alpha/beta fold hydrolase [Candidatus Rokuibacteriota bacterium]
MRASEAAGWTGQFVETNDIRMYGAQGGRGRPLVLLHGYGWDHSLWDDILTRFASRYRVIAGDSRGHGRSDKPAGPYTISVLARDWYGLVTALAAEPACLVGFSLGGMIASLLAVEHPETVEALVLVATLCEADPDLEVKLEARIRAAREEGPVAGAHVGARQIFSPRFMELHPDVIDRFVRWRASMPQEPLFETARAVYGFRVCERLREIRVPCLVVYGDDDAITPPPAARRIAESVPGARLVGIHGAGHMIPVEKPSELATVLDAFLTAHYAPTTRPASAG